MTSPQPESKQFCSRCVFPKPGSGCAGCPRETGHHFADARITRQLDVLIVSDSLLASRIVNVDALHNPYSDDAGSILKKSVDVLKKEDAHKELQVGFTYAVLCHGEDPNKSTLDRCNMFLANSVRTAAGPGERENPLVILALGANSVKALGINTRSLKEVQSRVLSVEVHGVPCKVIPTFSAKQLSSMSGIYSLFLNDMRRAMELSKEDTIGTASIEELTTGYIYPQTAEDVIKVCNDIMAYTEDGANPDNWAISIDTETTSLFAHRPTLRILALSCAWAPGKATAFPLWHKDCPYDVNAVLPAVRALLRSKKPKIMHNGKYDWKAFKTAGLELVNFAWDSMLGEHLISEDKKGQYDLKSMTRAYNPKYAPYADVIHALMLKFEGTSQLDNLRKEKVPVRREKLTPEEKEARKQAAIEAKKALKREKKRGGGKYGENAFENVPLQTLLMYAAVDADMTRCNAIHEKERMRLEGIKLEEKKRTLERDQLKRFPVPRLCTNPKPLPWLMTNVAVPASKVLGDMEHHGVPVDLPYLDGLTETLTKVCQEAEAELYRIVGRPNFTLKSAQAVGRLLFSEGYISPVTGERVVFEPISTTKKGQPQTTEKVLQQLVAKHECSFSAKLLVFRKAVKAKDTFLANVRDLASADGRMHTNFNLHGTSTGRLSSSDENMQNIPSKLAGCNIKKIFIPSDPSKTFVNCDAKAAEVRILTAYSRDAELIRTLNEGMDTHCFIASTVIALVRRDHDADEVLRSMGLDPAYPYTYEDFDQRDAWKAKDKTYASVLNKFRTAIKRVVFGVLYGAGPKKIAETIGISVEQARLLIELIFKLFPSIPTYVERTKWELNQFGFVETYFGRRRRIDLRGATPALRSRAERQGVNFKIQSTSNEIVLRRLIAMEEPLKRDLGGQLLLTVHDSIGFELPTRYVSHLPDFLHEILEKGAARDCPWLPVAFKWDFECGPSYGELSSYADFSKNLPAPEVPLMQQAYSEEEIRSELSAPDEVAA